MKELIIVQLQIPGVHSWSECDIDSVKYLSNPHRHIFHIKAAKRVEHDNRAIEIIQFKKQVKDYLKSWFPDYPGSEELNFGDSSCEQIAKLLLSKFSLFYCQVLEDGENGALVMGDSLNYATILSNCIPI